MQLIACWYRNIGPFLDRPVGIHFFNGAYLIKAQIGSGKSFLFFDGPMFGLYKWSRRPMLHRQAKEGQMQILFEHLGQTYLVCRNLTMTKAGNDSVETTLYKVERGKSKDSHMIGIESMIGYSNVLNRGVDSLESVLKGLIEEIPFKSGVELEATLASLLPPQEVIESSSILLQESDNIFEMTPGDRINIFKHLFGLLGIDEAKEVLADKKKEIAMQRSLLADTSQINTQFRLLIAGFLSFLDQFDNLATNIYPKILFPTKEDLVLTKETLQIEEFSRNIGDLQTISIRTQIQHDRDTFIAQHSTTQQRQQQLQSLQSQIHTLSGQKQLYLTDMAKVSNSIISIDNSKTEQLQTEKKNLSQQILELSSKHSFMQFQLLGYQVQSLIEASRCITQQIQSAELLKTKISHHDAEKLRYQQLQEELLLNKKRLSQQLSELEIALKKGDVYICENCQHENHIHGTTNETIMKQTAHCQQELDALKVKETDMQSKLLIYMKDPLEKGQLESIKQLFLTVPRKQIQEDAIVLQQLQDQSQSIDRQLQQYQSDIDRLATLQQEHIRLQTKIEETEKQLQVKSDELRIIESEKNVALHTNFIQEIQLREQLTKILDQIDQSNIRIGELVQSSREQLLKVKQLKDQEQIVTDLFAIYSKELMLVVLQDFLPSLEQAINANLAQVVDYEIKFELIKKTGDKLELEIFVTDEKGQRQVKSLSGGQKTVLKLVWILSVATMMKSQFLFMDETINNLDTDAIAKVAELIKNFVAYHDMKYYVVTHAPQIQEMGIWTKTIEL